MSLKSGYLRIEAAAQQGGWEATSGERFALSIHWSRLYALGDLLLEVVYDSNSDRVHCATLFNGEDEHQLGMLNRRKAERVIDVLLGKARSF